ncbi:MAG TPA: aromatic ring-hydroxylating dioxygenase subunit alpha [Acidimicrobiales bacterium]
MEVSAAPSPVDPGPAGAAAEYLLPPTAYHSASWYEQELDTVFGSRWTLVADAQELAAAGDYLAVTVGRAPLVVVRDGDGRLRAFHNLCRHRGMVLLEGRGTVDGAISCFYHWWRYALDGQLTVVPQRKEQFPDLVPEDWGLLPASLEVWAGMVFVHPDPTAPPLATALAGVVPHLGSHRPGLLTEVGHLRLEARCNWKLFVENHVDVYHLWYLHGASLGDFDHTRFEHRQTGGNWASYEPLRSGDVAAAALTRGTAAIGHLDDRDRAGIGAHLVFPNLMIATAAEFFATYVAEPAGPDRTVIDLRMRAEPEADAGALVDAVRSFIDEDIRACESVQAAVTSPVFAVGPLARDLERPITAFQSNVLAAMGAG